RNSELERQIRETRQALKRLAQEGRREKRELAHYYEREHQAGLKQLQSKFFSQEHTAEDYGLMDTPFLLMSDFIGAIQNEIGYRIETYFLEKQLAQEYMERLQQLETHQRQEAEELLKEFYDQLEGVRRYEQEREKERMPEEWRDFYSSCLD